VATRVLTRNGRRTTAVVLTAVLAAGACQSSAGRPAELGGLLRFGSSTSAQSQNDPQTDGSLVVVVEAQFPGTVDTVRVATAARLGDAGYEMDCPGGKDTTPPPGQQGTREPRIKCALGGHGTGGTVWLSTTPGAVVNLSALIGLSD
jgi:hypothetical protein